MMRAAAAVVARDLAACRLPIALVVALFLVPTTVTVVTSNPEGAPPPGPDEPPPIVSFLFPARLIASILSLVFLAACFERLLVNETRTGSIATVLRSPLSARRILAAKFLSVAVTGGLLMLGPALLLSAAAFANGVVEPHPILAGFGAAYAMWTGALGILLLALLSAVALTGVRALPQVPLRGPLAAVAFLSLLFTYLGIDLLGRVLGLFLRDPAAMDALAAALQSFVKASPLHVMADALQAALGVPGWQPPWLLAVLFVGLAAVAWPAASRLYVDRVAAA
ncbi:MAG TPA: hypothetical protein VM681_06640 [Candidatus Thermoplasmatota archaeon]|nr:hypothetical protein [Candidatus Thermoplasmatota archaeon]